MRPTINDIAKHCGVSVGTVDRALNDRHGINEKTKQHIMQVAKQMKYIPNHAGQSLATGATKTIGIVCFEFSNNFFPELIDAIEGEAKKHAYFIHLILSHKDKDLEKEGLDYLYKRHVDGIMLFPIGLGVAFNNYLKELNIPLVNIYNKVSSDFPHVGVDDKAAFFDAVTYLVSLKYEQIAFLTPQIDLQECKGNNVYTLKNRLNGYCEGVEREGLEPLIFQGKNLCEKMSCYYASNERGKRTALLCSSDTYALMIMRHLQQTGYSIPEDIGIMGFDNIDILQFIQPPLTTVQYSVKKWV